VFFIAWQQIRPDIQAVMRLTELTEKLTRENSDVMRQLSRMYQHLKNVEAQLKRVNTVARDLFNYQLRRGDFQLSELTKDTQDWIENESGDDPAPPNFSDSISVVKLKKLMIEYFSVEDMADIAFDLQVDTSGFRTKKELFAQSLIEAVRNRAMLINLVGLLKETRPNVNWNIEEDHEN
jgi:hypothetical protein